MTHRVWQQRAHFDFILLERLQYGFISSWMSYNLDSSSPTMIELFKMPYASTLVAEERSASVRAPLGG
jgi:hypothetical protein